jgi:hypothetical protein
MRTRSSWSVQEWDKMMQWKHADYEGMGRDLCPRQWTTIMDEVEVRSKRVQITEGTVGSGDISAPYLAAAEAYIQEM